MRSMLKKKLTAMARDMGTVINHSFYTSMLKITQEKYEKQYVNALDAWTAAMNGKGAHLIEGLIPDKALESDDDESVEL